MTQEHFILIEDYEMDRLEEIIGRFHDPLPDRNPLERLLVSAIAPALVSLKACCTIGFDVVTPEYPPDLPALSDIDLIDSKRKVFTPGKPKTKQEHISLDGMEKVKYRQEGDNPAELEKVLIGNTRVREHEEFMKSKDFPETVKLYTKEYITKSIPPTATDPDLPREPLDPGDFIIDDLGNTIPIKDGDIPFKPGKELP
jgi:hypothetical protein